VVVLTILPLANCVSFPARRWIKQWSNGPMANDPNRSGLGPETEEAKRTIQREAESAQQTAQQLSENVQRQAKEVSSDIQAQAQQMVSEQKEKARSGLMDVVSAMRRAADDLEHHQQPQVANIARSLASGLEDFSQAIGRRNLQDMLSDVENFARNHPTTFFGGSLLVGLALARFAKSSSRPSQSAARTEHIRQPGATYAAHTAPQTGQTGQYSEYGRHEREQSRGVEASITR
jgi:gas vesicle protein